MTKIEQRFAPDELNKLGQTTLLVSPIGLGTVKFGRDTDVRYPSSFKIPEYTELDKLIGFAKDLGINFLDTAPAYGSSEETLGRLLQRTRKDWIICTKIGEQYSNGQSRFEFSRTANLRSIEQSLHYLKTDYLDIVLIHLGAEDADTLRHSDAVNTLIKLKEDGKVRYIGASTKTVEGGLLALEALDLVMVTYNPQDTSQLAVLEEASKKGKGVIIKKALASGHANKVKENLKFVLEHPSVSSAIVGTINENHLQQNVADARSTQD